MQDGKQVVLCIDDASDVLSVLEIILTAEGFVFVGAHSAEEGQELYRNRNPDAVIVDLMMEEVDAGTQFARELRVLRNAAPVFMLSSVGDNFNLTADYTNLGLAGIFQKPIDKQSLVTVLRASLAATAG